MTESGRVILAQCDLADVNQDVGALYHWLNQHRPTRFATHERLMLYSAYVPSLALMQHIMHALTVLDLDACFVLIRTPHNLRTLFAGHAFVQQLDFDIADVDSQLLKVDRHIDNRHSLCVMPWANVNIGNQGELMPCCLYDSPLSNIRHETLIGFAQGQAMNDLRHSMLQGHRPSACSACWTLEDQGIESHRQRNLRYHAKSFYTQWLQDKKIRTLDIKPGHECNFHCRSCGPELSSRIAVETLKDTQDSKKAAELRLIMQRGRWLDESPQFIDEFTLLQHDLVNIDFFGGEPLLSRRVWHLIESLVSTGRAAQVRVHFNTNGSIFPSKQIELLSQFREVDIALSIDALGTRFELQRGGKWSEVLENTNSFIDLSRAYSNIQVRVMPLVNIQNVLYIDDVLDWAQALDIPVILNYLHNPWFLSIDYLTPQAKQLVVNKLSGSHHDMVKNILNKIRQGAGSDGKDFCQYMQALDQKRAENFSTNHQDIAQAMGYQVN